MGVWPYFNDSTRKYLDPDFLPPVSMRKPEQIWVFIYGGESLGQVGETSPLLTLSKDHEET
jgi:hypothetical protein